MVELRCCNKENCVRYSSPSIKLGSGNETTIERATGKCCSPIAFIENSLLAALFSGVTSPL